MPNFEPLPSKSFNNGQKNFPFRGKDCKSDSHDGILAKQPVGFAQRCLKGNRPYDHLLSCHTMGKVSSTTTSIVPAKELGWIHKFFGSAGTNTLQSKELCGWWWRSLLHLTKGLEWLISVSQRIMTDASSYEWVAHLNNEKVQGRWSPVSFLQYIGP